MATKFVKLHLRRICTVLAILTFLLPVIISSKIDPIESSSGANYLENYGIPKGQIVSNSSTIYDVQMGGTYSVGENERTAYAILCGVEDYPGEDSDLECTVDDVLDFKSFAKNEMFIPLDNIVTLTDSAATCDGIKAQIQSVSSKMDANDVLFFQYSGHGGPSTSNSFQTWTINYYAPDVKEDIVRWTYSYPGAGLMRVHFQRVDMEEGYDGIVVGDINDEEYVSDIIMYNEINFWSNWVESSALYVDLYTSGTGGWNEVAIDRVEIISFVPPYMINPWDGLEEGLLASELNTEFSGVPGDIVGVIDSCFSGDFCSAIAAPRRLLFSACGPDEYSFEDPAYHNGVFSYHFLKSWSALTANSDDSSVSLESCYYQCKADVTSHASNMGGSQHPQMYDGLANGTYFIPKVEIGEVEELSDGLFSIKYRAQGVGSHDIRVQFVDDIGRFQGVVTFTNIAANSMEKELLLNFSAPVDYTNITFSLESKINDKVVWQNISAEIIPTVTGDAVNPFHHDTTESQEEDDAGFDFQIDAVTYVIGAVIIIPSASIIHKQIQKRKYGKKTEDMPNSSFGLHNKPIFCTVKNKLPWNHNGATINLPLEGHPKWGATIHRAVSEYLGKLIPINSPDSPFKVVKGREFFRQINFTAASGVFFSTPNKIEVADYVIVLPGKMCLVLMVIESTEDQILRRYDHNFRTLKEKGFTVLPVVDSEKIIDDISSNSDSFGTTIPLLTIDDLKVLCKGMFGAYWAGIIPTVNDPFLILALTGMLSRSVEWMLPCSQDEIELMIYHFTCAQKKTVQSADMTPSRDNAPKGFPDAIVGPLKYPVAIGIIGLGMIGQQIIDVLERNWRFKIVGVYDGNKDVCDQVNYSKELWDGNYYGKSISITDNLIEICQDERVQVFLIDSALVQDPDVGQMFSQVKRSAFLIEHTKNLVQDLMDLLQ